MKKNMGSTLNYITGVLFAIAAILIFTNNKIPLGITYTCLAITYIVMGFHKMKKNKDKIN